MKAILSILTASLMVILLSCAGCEPEPQTQPATEIIEGAVTEIPQAVQPAESQPEEIEAAEETPSRQDVAEPAEATEEALAEEDIVESESKSVTEPVIAEESVSLPAGVAVRANGIEITEAQIEEITKPVLGRLNKAYANKGKDKNYEASLKRIRGQAIEGLITTTLIGQEMEKENITITDEQVEEYIMKMAAQENMTLADLKMLVSSGGNTYEQWKEQMQFDKRVGVLKLVEAANLGGLDVNEADALKFYESNKRHYSNPERVKASHILIKPDTSDPNTDPNQADAQALAEAEQLLGQIKSGADFAELAKENSACPSGQNGGDLGFGAEKTWVKNFSKAAFALQPGEISDVVKTKFGYHIIKVTDRQEAGVTSFEDAKDEIMKRLRAQREMRLGSEYIMSLRKKAQVEYSPADEQYKPKVR